MWVAAAEARGAFQSPCMAAPARIRLRVTRADVSVFKRLVLQDGLEEKQVRLRLALETAEVLARLRSPGALRLAVEAELVAFVAFVAEMREVRSILRSALHFG